MPRLTRSNALLLAPMHCIQCRPHGVRLKKMCQQVMAKLANSRTPLVLHRRGTESFKPGWNASLRAITIVIRSITIARSSAAVPSHRIWKYTPYMTNIRSPWCLGKAQESKGLRSLCTDGRTDGQHAPCRDVENWMCIFVTDHRWLQGYLFAKPGITAVSTIPSLLTPHYLVPFPPWEWTRLLWGEKQSHMMHAVIQMCCKRKEPT